MFKAIFSSKDISNNKEYYSFVYDLINNEKVQMLAQFRHHIGTTRLQHSLNVSYYNYKLCKMLRLDFKSAARAGLLHDFFLYDRKKHIKTERSHSAEHAKIALENASDMFKLNEREADMIINHMWPMTHKLPQYGETFAITLVDKFCAVAEVVKSASCFTERKLRAAHALLVLLAINNGFGHLQ